MLVLIISLAIIIGAYIYFNNYVNKAKSSNTFKEKGKIIEFMPSALTSLGVLGTFFGISLGLSDFNPANISESITTLLEGLKTAFWTSIAGIFLTIVLSRKINKIASEQEANTPSSEQEALNRINLALAEMNKSQQSMNSRLENVFNQNNNLQTRMIDIMESQNNSLISALSELSHLNKSGERIIDVHSEIVGMHNDLSKSIKELSEVNNSTKLISKGTTDILNQINELSDNVASQLSVQEANLEETKNLSSTVRSEIVIITDAMEKGNKLMTEKFDEFSELMRKNNIEALVEVMKKVTEEFNKQMKDIIDKLIQDNFEELNKSVERLNTWQKENKEMISDLTSDYKDMTSEFKNTSDILNKVAQNTHTLVDDNGHLNRLINELRRVIIDDTKFSEMTTKLTESVEKIKNGTESFDEATTELNMWIRNHKDLGDGVSLLVRRLDELNKLRDFNEHFWQETKKNMNEGVGIVADASKKLNTSVTRINEDFYERLNSTLTNLDLCIQAMYDKRRN